MSESEKLTAQIKRQIESGSPAMVIAKEFQTPETEAFAEKIGAEIINCPSAKASPSPPD